MAVKHLKVITIPDGPDNTAVRPSDWMADHLIDPGTVTLAMLANISATKRLIGRNTAGAGVQEEVTASQLLDWISAANGALLTRTGGNWAALANVSTDNGDLVLTENASPVAPAAGTAKLFGTSSGGRQMIAALAPAGAKMTMQPFLGKRWCGIWQAQGNNTQIGVVGTTTPLVAGTQTARNVASSSFATSLKRVGLVSGASSGSVSGVRNGNAQFWRGNTAGAGGFHVVSRFLVSDAGLVSTGRLFVGMQASTSSPTDVDPSTIANTVGIGCDANDTVLQLYASGSAAQARTSLGASFPLSTSDVYELALYCPPNGSNITYQVTRLNTGDVTAGTISAAANLPSSTTLLCQQMWRSNGSTAAAVGLDLISMYIETDV